MALRLGEYFLREQRLSPGQLQDALDRQRAHGGRLGSHLIALRLVRDEEVASFLSRQYGVPAFSLSQLDLDPTVVRLIPAETASKYQVIPVGRAGATLTLAMTDPTNVSAVDDVRFRTGLQVDVVVASEHAVREAIDRYYGRPASARAAGSDLVSRALQDLPPGDDVAGLQEAPEISAAAIEGQGGEAPVIRLVNALLLSAIQRGASDIHVEPYENEMRVRFRIDGVLHPVVSPPLRHRDAITSRLKIMARLDIAERRLPQDGRLKARLNTQGKTREIDCRVSCLPTLFGEKLVLRLLDRDELRLEMTRLGLEPEARRRFEAAVRRPWGMVLVTGPTGSGKTSTLYSALARLNQPGVNILTVEDPVEFNIPGINQVQVRDQIGLTFASALRSFLRQDPNVILVGEIRDAETAAIAVKAALTGHLVLSTLHTNDAPSTVNRLVNMGVEAFLVASSVNLVCAQRLVRRVCDACSGPAALSVEALVDAGFHPAEAPAVRPMRGRGCERCDQTGYKGRIGLFEVMEITDPLRLLVLDNAPVSELRSHAVAAGMMTLRQSGLRKVIEGVTTIEEVARETIN